MSYEILVIRLVRQPESEVENLVFGTRKCISNIDLSIVWIVYRGKTYDKLRYAIELCPKLLYNLNLKR